MELSIPHRWHFSNSGLRKNLFIVLHGRGDSPSGFTWLPEALDIPDLNYLFLQAPDSYGDGFSWYDLPPHQLPGIKRSRILLERIFLEINTAGFENGQCLLFGFSQGSLMTLEFGSRYPHLLKGYIGISGYCYDTDRLLSEASPEIIHDGHWLITHGTLDEALNIEVTRSQMKKLMSHGFKMDYREYPKSHTIDPNVELPFIRNWILERMENEF